MKRLGLLLLPLLALTSCTTVTTFTNQWQNQDVDQRKVENILVLALTNNRSSREDVEIMVSQQLRNWGVKSGAGFKYFPYDTTKVVDTSEIRKVLMQNGYDAVLTIALKDYNKVEGYVPPQTTVSGGMYGGMYGGYGYWGSPYGYGVGVSYSPGYTYTSVTVKLESRLYLIEKDASKGGLVWAGYSTTQDPTDISDQATSYASALINALKYAGYIEKAKD